MAKKTPSTTPAPGDERLIPPPNGVAVRMYRIGHGDCFLLAIDGDQPGKPVYVLIDCGYKPGSPKHLKTPTTSATVAENIRKATNGHLDVAIITHEHQDHVNGITEKNFKDISIGEAWFAWTEDPADSVANDLRKKFKDKLLGLVAANNQLAAVKAISTAEQARLDRMGDLLAFELGGDDDTPFTIEGAPAVLGVAGESMNKKSMRLFKERAKKGPVFIRPHGGILALPGTTKVRVFALGPPRDPELLKSLDPQGSEEFHLARGSAGAYFAAAACAADGGGSADRPFARPYWVFWKQARADAEFGAFFTGRYGFEGDVLVPSVTHPPGLPVSESHGNAPWRRIDHDWLFSSEQLALDMNDQTNNSSLALAFELGKGGKVLLFAADAQRGNWISWAKKTWKDGKTKITAKDLLSRTVLYKVGHHGSHNATLNGDLSDPSPNLSWMATGDHAREFTAMITAVRSWAETQKGWDHPLKAIKDALLKKAAGRVFQTDTDFADMTMAKDGSQVDWTAFTNRTTPTALYFDYRITP